ncbi:MAG: ATPase [Alphaproteobacteria bacterium]|nr:MAG: ATPase [Alphaproteobacteria bacterium]
MDDLGGVEYSPRTPMRVEDVGINPVMQRDILLKTMFRQNLRAPTEISDALKVAPPVVDELLEDARAQGLVETLGVRGASVRSELRYGLTDSGKARAIDALEQSEYFGPFPVPLEEYRRLTRHQTIRNATISREMLERSMRQLVLPQGLLDQIGPAVNSGRSILLYGPPGNGKSSIANGIRDAMTDTILVPRVIEVAGQVISLYDPVIHRPVEEKPGEEGGLRLAGLGYDPRFVRCVRPSVITGGELTLDMLDLNFNPVSRTYQAPLQLKAAGGVFIVDDLGRQAQSPMALINRWIVPMEKGFDLLSLQSGQKFEVPFDTLVIFSTNFAPAELFDGAALRRVYYKIKIDRPSRDDFIKIFARTCKAYGVMPDEQVLTHLLRDLYPKTQRGFAAYHAPFLIDQALSICTYEGRPRKLTNDLIDRAWTNLYIDDED